MYHVVTLKRSYKKDRTDGVLTLPSGKTLVTLERPWLDNLCNKSCIPPGVYLCNYLERSNSGKYKRCWHVQNVPGRSGILWHPGNLVRHTLGCILPGLCCGVLEGQTAVLSSAAAMNIIRSELGGMNFVLIIR